MCSNSRFELHRPTVTCFVYNTEVLGQSEGVSKEVCLRGAGVGDMVKLS